MAILLHDNVSAADVLNVLQGLQAKGVHSKLLYARMGEVTADDGSSLPVAATFAGSPSLTVDGVIVPGGDVSELLQNGDAKYYLLEAYKHLKTIALLGDARQFKALLGVDAQGEDGIVEADSASSILVDDFLTHLAAHRVWSRIGKIDSIPA